MPPVTRDNSVDRSLSRSGTAKVRRFLADIGEIPLDDSAVFRYDDKERAAAMTVVRTANRNASGEFNMLRIENLTFGVNSDGQEKEIIRDISLTIPDGRLVVITGPNGGGKSTLAKLIAGIEKPSSGRIYFNDADITDLSITERARMGIGFAFQQPVKFKGIKVLDLIKLAAGRELTVAECCAYLSQVGLCAAEYINREVNASLSGGELKRIEIATVLARKSMLTIFDEPEAGIDLWSFNNLTEVFLKQRREISGRSILIISHQERILEIADEIIVLRDGVVDRQGSRDEILPTLIGSSMAVPACKGVEET
jgi:Fe-S cluster assembly ATP-binding protein